MYEKNTKKCSKCPNKYIVLDITVRMILVLGYWALGDIWR